MGFGDLLKQAIKTTGDALRESGENITWADIDYDKLRASRLSNPNITSWSARPRDGGTNAEHLATNIKVNDSKGGVGGWVHPSTEEVRQALNKIVAPQQSLYSIDPYVGFSEAFMSNEMTYLPSSQSSVSPVSQARDSQEDNVTEYMGRPLSDDDDDNPRVGQIT